MVQNRYLAVLGLLPSPANRFNVPPGKEKSIQFIPF
jgi:hypothetical protein